MSKNKIMSEDKIVSDTVISSSDSRVFKKGRFILGAFDGPPTGKNATVPQIMDIFLLHQRQRIESICQDLGISIQDGVIKKKSTKSFSRSYKVGVYKDDVVSEQQLEWVDKEILDYFRNIWFDVAIDFSQPASAWVTHPVYIKISSK